MTESALEALYARCAIQIDIFTFFTFCCCLQRVRIFEKSQHGKRIGQYLYCKFLEVARGAIGLCDIEILSSAVLDIDVPYKCAKFWPHGLFSVMIGYNRVKFD